MNDLKLIDDIKIMYKKDILLWGAGRIGRECAAYLAGSDMHVIGFCDNNEQLKGKYVEGYRVFSKGEIQDELIRNRDIAVVITSDYLEEIHEALIDLRVSSDNIFSKFALQYSIFKNIDNAIIPKCYRENFKKNYQRWRIINHKRADYRFSFKYYAYNWEKIIQKNPIVIFQPGKVASTTILKSISACGLESVATHALAYREEFMDDEMRHLYLEFKKSISNAQCIKIISAVREPVKRDISYIFEHVNLPFVEIYKDFNNQFVQDVYDCLDNYFVKKKENFDGMSPTLIHHMLRINGGIFQWFEREMEAVYNIDILAYPFDKKKGYTVIKKDNIELLLFKLEKLNNLEREIGEFLGVNNFKIVNANLAAGRDYRYAYKQTLNTIKLPETYLDMYYKNNKYMNHFYSKEEQADYLKEWHRV